MPPFVVRSRSCQEHQIDETLERTPESLFPKQGASLVGRTGVQASSRTIVLQILAPRLLFPGSQTLTYHSRMDGTGNLPGVNFDVPFVNAKHLTVHMCFYCSEKAIFHLI